MLIPGRKRKSKEVVVVVQQNGFKKDKNKI